MIFWTNREATFIAAAWLHVLCGLLRVFRILICQSFRTDCLPQESFQVVFVSLDWLELWAISLTLFFFFRSSHGTVGWQGEDIGQREMPCSKMIGLYSSLPNGSISRVQRMLLCMSPLLDTAWYRTGGKFPVEFHWFPIVHPTVDCLLAFWIFDVSLLMHLCYTTHLCLWSW